MTPDADKISPKNAGDCQLDKSPFYQCCCVCSHHVHTRSWRSKEIGFACDVWRALPDDNGMIEVDWPEHSCGCELWDDTRPKTEKDS